MIRKVTTILGVAVLFASIVAGFNGEMTIAMIVYVVLDIIALILLWMPPSYFYKLFPSLKKLDRHFFKYAWFRRLLKLVVGQKEYSETEATLKSTGKQ